jgi:4-carboxymuconolactone decarboxylase
MTSPSAIPSHAAESDEGTSRLPFIPRGSLDQGGTALWDSTISRLAGGAVNEEGGLVGPYNAWLTAPAIGTRLADLLPALRFDTSVERRLLELAIITTAALWGATFDWSSHSQMAVRTGIDQGVIDAIASNQVPPFIKNDERAVYELVEELVADGHVCADTYEAAQALIGDQAMVELVSVCGFYTLVSFTLNAFVNGPAAGADTSMRVRYAVPYPGSAWGLSLPPFHW